MIVDKFNEALIAQATVGEALRVHTSFGADTFRTPPVTAIHFRSLLRPDPSPRPRTAATTRKLPPAPQPRSHPIKSRTPMHARLDPCMLQSLQAHSHALNCMHAVPACVHA